MTAFREDYRNAIDAFVGSQSAGQVDAYAEQIEAALEDVVIRMRTLAVNEKGLHYAKGDVAEAFHEGTFNVDAARRGIEARAWAPRDTSPVDIRVTGSASDLAQLKYYRDADATAKAISEPKYRDLEQKVVPADQLEEVRAAAARLAKGNAQTRPELAASYDAQTRPELAASYDHTATTADDRIRMDGAESRPLTEAGSRDLVNGLRGDQDLDRAEFGLTPQQVVTWEDILRESGTAAAAMISVALQSAPYLVSIARKAWDTGEISGTDFVPLGQALPPTILRSGLAAGLAAAITGSARAGLLGSIQQVDPTFVSAGVVLAISALEASVDAARGNTTWPEAARAISQDAIILAAAIGGAAAGQALVPIPVLGALIGNIVGAAAGRLVVDQADRVIVGLAADTGWAVFGTVDQHYTVPKELLTASGWDTLELRPIELKTLELKPLELKTLDLNSVDMTVLRRGVVSFRRIGYLS